MTDASIGLPFAAFAAYVALLACAALCDVWKFVIPDSISIALAGLFLVAAAPALDDPAWLSHLGAAGVVFAAGLVFFRLGALGGGDVKLLTAVSLWAGFEYLADLLVIVSLLGGAIALLLVLARRALQGARARLRRSPQISPPKVLLVGESVPYAMAIAPAGIWVGAALPTFAAIWA